MKEINLIDIIERQRENKYSLLMVHKKTHRAFAITTGFSEAWAIIVALKNIDSERPSTSNLLYNLTTSFDLKFKRIDITNSSQNLFYAKARFESSEKEEVLDCRPSDGIALAIKYGSPMFISSRVLQKFSFRIPFKYWKNPTKHKGINAIIDKVNRKKDAEQLERKRINKTFITDITRELIEYAHQ